MKEKKMIGIGYLTLAFLFLFNPNLTLIDPLPDFIGYILLCAGIYRLSDIHDRVGEAYKAFKKMILIDAGKWIAVFWVFGMSVPSERNTSVLLWTFVFAALEFIFLVPAYIKLFDGLTQVGYLYPCKAVFGKNEKRSRADRMRALTVAFVIVKAVLTTLPEFADLTNASYDENGGGLVNLYNYIGLMRAMAFIPVLILGIVWVINIIAYFRAVAKDRAFTDALAEKYKNDILPKQGLFVRRNFSTVILLLTVAACLTVDFRLEDQNLIPDFLAAAMFIVAFFFVKKHTGLKAKAFIPPTLVYTVFSIASAVLEYSFFSRYYLGAIIKSDEARALYISLVAVNVFKGICLFAVLYVLYRALCKLISQHTGYVVGMERAGESEERMIGEIHRELKKYLVYSLVAAGVYITSDICYDILIPKLNFMGFINIIFAAVFIGVFLRALFAIQSAVETKYMLE